MVAVIVENGFCGAEAVVLGSHVCFLLLDIGLRPNYVIYSKLKKLVVEPNCSSGTMHSCPEPAKDLSALHLGYFGYGTGVGVGVLVIPIRGVMVGVLVIVSVTNAVGVDPLSDSISERISGIGKRKGLSLGTSMALIA